MKNIKQYNWKNIISLLMRYKKELIIANLVSVIATLCSVPTPLFVPLLIDEVLLEKPGKLVEIFTYLFGEPSIFHYAMGVLFVVISLRILVLLMNIFQLKIFTLISKNIIFLIRKHILRHLQNINMKEYEMIESGSISSKLITDLNTIEDFIGKSVAKFTTAILSIIAICGILIWINPLLAMIITVMNPVVIMISSKMSKKIANFKKEENQAISIFQESLIETFELFTQIRTSNRENGYINSLIGKANTIRKKAIAFSYKGDAKRSVSFFIFLVGVEFFRSATIIMVFYDEVSIGLMLGVFAYLWFMMGPVEEILQIQYNYNSANIAITRINEILRMHTEPKYLNKHNPFSENIEIEVKNLDFSYGDNEILKKANLFIKKKERVALVGASGSGKTTLMQVLIGFYPPDGGDILFNNISTKEIGLDKIRENVFLILQAPMVFNDTVRENLLMGKHISDEKIMQALKMAQMHELISQMPNGLDTYLGKQGIRLSGGQRQRLAIARMILKEPKVVIFDESTSSLDTDTERLVFEALEPFLEDKTILMIAHRLHTVKKADSIYSIEDKKIVQIKDKEAFFAQADAYLSED